MLNVLEKYKESWCERSVMNNRKSHERSLGRQEVSKSGGLDFILFLNTCSEKILEGLKQRSEMARLTFLKISLIFSENKSS